MNVKLPDFSHVEQALYRVDADYSAPECHGAACGMLALNSEADEGTWLSFVLPAGDMSDYLYQETRDLLHDLFQAAHAQLNDSGLNLELFIPDEEQPLSERFQAIQKWCQGLALGVAASGIKSLDDLSADSREWFEDAIKIGSSGDYEVEDGDDEAEQAVSEIYGFLSVGILMMNEEMQPLISQPQLETDYTLH